MLNISSSQFRDEMILPYSVDLRLIAACNLKCPFCFGPRHWIRSMPLDNVLSMIDLLGQSNTRAVVISGGEPTLYEGIIKVLKRAKKYQLVTILSTNGIMLKPLLANISQFIDWIALPIDSYRKDINSKMRGGFSQHLDIVLDLLKHIKQFYPHLKIKIGTVVTKINKEYISDIPHLFTEPFIPDRWKLYQLSFSNYAKDNRDILEIPELDYYSVMESSCMQAAMKGIKFASHKNRDRNGKYFFINPSGDILTIKDGDEYLIGNIISNSKLIFNTWKRYIDEDKIMRNFQDTYSL